MCIQNWMHDKATFLAAIGDAFPTAVMLAPETNADGPDATGAYALAIMLYDPVAFALRGTAHSFSPGYYVYAGSARGPGGIRARLQRHFRREKKPHWHVDRLTLSAVRLCGFAIPGGSECDIVTRLGRLAGFSHPLAGFGSSDCPVCASHLLVSHMAMAQVVEPPLARLPR